MSETIKCPKDLLQRLGFSTQREWKIHRRKKLKELEAAMDDFRLGCAYAPGYVDGTIRKLDAALDSLKKSHTVKEWGR